MARKTDAEILAECQALDEAYARAAAFDDGNQRIYKLEQALRDIRDNYLWLDECDVRRIANNALAQITADEDCDPMAELRKAALNRGQP